MTNEQRKIFWDILCALSGDNLAEDSKKLKEVIHFPQHLFRYREVNSNTLDALRTNKMYFSTSNYYDDPFDTFLNINMEEIKREFDNNFNSKENVDVCIKAFKEVMGDSVNRLFKSNDIEEFNEEKVSEILSQGMVQKYLKFLEELRNELKKEVWSVCFSEKGFNETLWLKYANQHKGFVLMYDMQADNKLNCGTMEKCKQCGISNCGTPLYPMYYSDEKYDATEFAKLVAMKKIDELFPMADLTSRLYPLIPSMCWEREKTTLIKKKCHEHDEEWRMVTGCTMKSPIIMKWIPSGLILGIRMSVADENLVIRMAQEAGVDKIYKSYINKSGDLDAEQIMVNL